MQRDQLREQFALASDLFDFDETNCARFCNLSIQDSEFNHEELVATVNARQTTWTAEVSSKFQGMSIEEAKRLMGTVVDPLWTLNSPKKAKTSEFLSAELPAAFDSRENWPECQNVIGHVRDQSNCGSCWAHGTTEAFNDRLCIATQGEFTELLSTADTTGCCNFLRCFSMGCNGGQIGSPWNFFKKYGVVSGGDYGANDTCYPYTMPFCSHHIEGSPYADCGSVKQVAPECAQTCANDADYKEDKHYGQSSYSLGSVDEIKADIYAHGPVTAAFMVYEDFVNYKSGVYRHTTGSRLGGHAVKIIGWGEDHWLVMNSWNETWGDQGLFRIAFGECGIDGQVHAGLT